MTANSHIEGVSWAMGKILAPLGMLSVSFLIRLLKSIIK